MHRSTLSAALIVALSLLACGGGAPAPTIVDHDESETRSAPPATELDPENPELIVRPFTAEQIRDEMVVGLKVLLRRSYPEQTTVERWTVIDADEDSVEIEYATISDDGSQTGQPSTSRSTWIELRDHASFPASHSTREWVSRSTQLGQFEGWLYTVANPDKATVQEFFFVPSLPGAPVQLRTIEGETTVFEMEQMARLRPEHE